MGGVRHQRGCARSSDGASFAGLRGTEGVLHVSGAGEERLGVLTV